MDAFQASTVTPESNKPNAKGYLDNLHAPYNLNIATTPSTISNANTMVMATMDLYLNGPDGPWNLVGPPRCHDPTTAVNAFDLNYSSAANQSFDMSRPPVRVGPLTDRTAPPTSCPSNIHPPSNAATPSSRSIQNSTRIPHLLGQISNTNPHKKRKTRKKMDFQEKESYNEICKMRACPKCRKGKRKCSSSHHRPTQDLSDTGTIMTEVESIERAVLRSATPDLLDLVNGVLLDETDFWDSGRG